MKYWKFVSAYMRKSVRVGANTHARVCGVKICALFMVLTVHKLQMYQL